MQHLPTIIIIICIKINKNNKRKIFLEEQVLIAVLFNGSFSSVITKLSIACFIQNNYLNIHQFCTFQLPSQILIPGY